MLARAPVRSKPRKSELKAFKAPTGGWIANRNIADPATIASLGNNSGAQGAIVLDNFIPRATSAILRRGSELYATLGTEGEETTSIFSYNVGTVQKLFASTAATIYDITTIVMPFNWVLSTEDGDTIVTEDGDTFGQDSTTGLETWEGALGGNWIVVQFATLGGIYLIGVNGESEGFVYDGTAFYPNVAGGVWALSYDAGTGDFTPGLTVTGGTSGATGVIVEVVESVTPGVGALLLKDIAGTFQDNEALTDTDTGAATAAGVETSVVPGVEFTGVLTTADMSFVWVYQNRLWFVQKESLSAWYLDIDSIGGEATEFPLAGVFGRGGSLLFGATWSLDSGAQGGLSEQCVFVTTEGEVAVYQGADPEQIATWQKVGVYRIGTPLGNRSFIRAGGDLVIGTTVGFVPLSQAIQRDMAALSPSAVSFLIEDAWNAAVARQPSDWKCEVWPELQISLVSPPKTDDYEAELFVANTRTGAWARITNWDVRCMHVFKGELYFGSTGGRVVKANVGGTDEGLPYTGCYVPLFEDFGSPSSLKIPLLARPVVRSTLEPNVEVNFLGDFNVALPPPPNAPVITESGNEWGTGIWGQAVWGGTSPDIITQQWQSIGGTGYAVSLVTQVTSAQVRPLDVELIRTEMTYQTAEIVT